MVISTFWNVQLCSEIFFDQFLAHSTIGLYAKCQLCHIENGDPEYEDFAN